MSRTIDDLQKENPLVSLWEAKKQAGDFIQKLSQWSKDRFEKLCCEFLKK